MKKYQYTILEQGGGKTELKPSKEKSLKQLYKILNCSTVEIIPPEYYKDRGYGRCIMWGDEEARFNNKNHRNPHFDTIVAADGLIWDVYGDVLMQKLYKDK